MKFVKFIDGVRPPFQNRFWLNSAADCPILVQFYTGKRTKLNELITSTNIDNVVKQTWFGKIHSPGRDDA